MNALKKLGRILFCLLPVLLAFVIQVIVSFGGVFLKFILELISNHDSLNQMTDADYIMDFVMDSQFLAGLSAIYAIIAALILGFWYWKRFVPKKQPRREINSLINFPVLVGLILLMLGMQYISNYVVLFLASIKPSWYQTYEDLMKSIGFGNVTLILALYSIVIAPISTQ